MRAAAVRYLVAVAACSSAIQGALSVAENEFDDCDYQSVRNDLIAKGFADPTDKQVEEGFEKCMAQTRELSLEAMEAPMYAGAPPRATIPTEKVSPEKHQKVIIKASEEPLVIISPSDTPTGRPTSPPVYLTTTSAVFSIVGTLAEEAPIYVTPDHLHTVKSHSLRHAPPSANHRKVMPARLKGFEDSDTDSTSDSDSDSAFVDYSAEESFATDDREPEGIAETNAVPMLTFAAKTEPAADIADGADASSMTAVEDLDRDLEMAPRTVESDTVDAFAMGDVEALEIEDESSGEAIFRKSESDHVRNSEKMDNAIVPAVKTFLASESTVESASTAASASPPSAVVDEVKGEEGGGSNRGSNTARFVRIGSQYGQNHKDDFVFPLGNPAPLQIVPTPAPTGAPGIPLSTSIYTTTIATASVVGTLQPIPEIPIHMDRNVPLHRVHSPPNHTKRRESEDADDLEMLAGEGVDTTRDVEHHAYQDATPVDQTPEVCTSTTTATPQTYVRWNNMLLNKGQNGFRSWSSGGWSSGHAPKNYRNRVMPK